MSMRTAVALTALLLMGAAPDTAAAPACPPDGWTRPSLQQLLAAGFDTLPPAQTEALGRGLVACLDDADPALRDGIAYTGLSAWMRGGRFSTDALRALRADLYDRLDAPDPQGFGRPFAALVLAEVARTDRVAPWMAADERAVMVERAAAYLEGVDDYRGFQAGDGWRHGVAHGADWLMQLSLNPALDRVQRQRILDAVGRQVVPAQHAYIFGEPERLAMPVLLLARAGLHDEAGWQAWLEALSASASLGDAALAWQDTGWLARRHNLRAFLSALHVSASLSDDAAVNALLPGTAAVLRAMP